MKTTARKTYTPSIWNTYFRFGAIGLWFVMMSYAAYGALFIHAFIGSAAMTVLTYLSIKQAKARATYLSKRRVKQLSNYHVGEDYMKIFDSNEQRDS